WEQSIISNQRAIAVSADYATRAKLDGVLAGVPHGYDFMSYAYLQLGQDAKARALLEPVAAITKTIGPRIAAATAQNAVPARYVLERQDWQAAAQLKPVGTGLPAAEAITHFARAIGAARSGAPAAAQADIDTLKDLRGQLEKANQGYWAGQVEIQVLGAQAWTAQATGNRGGGEAHARGRRSRGQQREARGHGEPPLPDARAAGRHAHGPESAEGRADGVRGVDEELADAVARILWRGQSGRRGRRHEEGSRLFRQAGAPHPQRRERSAGAAGGSQARREPMIHAREGRAIVAAVLLGLVPGWPVAAIADPVTEDPSSA